MSAELLSAAVMQSISRNLSVADLIRTAETLKQSGQESSILTLYRSWIGHNADHPLLCAVLFNYAVTLTDDGQLQPAREALERAIQLNPDFMPAYINLGRIYERMGQTGMAVVQWSAAVARSQSITGTAIQHKTTALNQAARALEGASQDQAAEDFLRQSLEIDNQQREVIQHLIALRQRQCHRPIALTGERISQKTLMEGISPLSAAGYTDDPLFQLAVGWNYNRLDVGRPASYFRDWPAAEAHQGKLRIGYLSSDLREHAVGYLMTDVFGLHDRNNVEVFAYYSGPVATDKLHEHFQQQADHFTNITAMNDDDAANLIRRDGIQILVDLNGYTREGRVKLVARRPAPVIVNWLGFPGTMGSPVHNYIVADDWIIPPESEKYYTEKVLRLPCYQPLARHRSVAPKRPTRAEAGLPEDAMVYCCFNGTHKITRFTFERWMMILASVPGSVLWLLSSTPEADERLKGYAAEQGIDPSRILFAGKLANPYHLARYPLADLFLDTTPYGAHTTASDALWMGLPVLTLSGRGFASRVCGSLVRSAGIPELITHTAEEFTQLAITLGQDRAMLASFRERLAKEHDSCILFDMQLLVSRMEGLYAQMWQEYRAGQLPIPDLRNLEVYLEIGAAIPHEETEVQMVADYEGWWREKLLDYHHYRPLQSDARMLVELAPKPAELAGSC